MEQYYIEGGKRIEGEIEIHGAKNSALPILAATLLVEHSVIHNCPDLSDVRAACNILQFMGCKTSRIGDSVIVENGETKVHAIPDNLMREMRSSIVFLGAIISKCKKATISLPGGCELGPRPIDLHLSSLEKLGVTISEEHGYLICTAEKGLCGATISLPFPSVGATENILLAACMADGETVIHNAAREPEISDLADFLNRCGGKIKINNDGTIHINGVKKLFSVEHIVIPDRIVAATYLCAAAITQGEVLIKKVNPKHLMSVLPAMEESGCDIVCTENTIYLKKIGRPKRIHTVRTMPYPGFPTDAQSLIMSLMAVADGTSIFVENIFENRYKQTAELMRMGAKIKVEGRVAIVEGVDKLHGAMVQCNDLRGGAALCLAALAADGESNVTNIKHIERGYACFDKYLSTLGAKIKRS